MRPNVNGPSCVELGERSQVRQTVTRGAEPSDLFYDEDGEWHIHDPNTPTFRFRCSAGHAWEEQDVDQTRCSCGWSANQGDAANRSATP
jgi:hypothetical protein